MSRTTFDMPPQRTNAAGELRRVGFELEFAGLPLARAAEAVRELVGGRVVEDDRFRLRVEVDGLGDFVVEADADLLRDGRYLDHLQRLGVPVHRLDTRQPIEELVSRVAELVVPSEVATPPIPLDRLDLVDDLRDALARRQARGTASRLRYAFGLHLNPEAPALDADSVLRHLRAFLALYDHLLESSAVDLTRSLTPFIDEFPDDYRRRVLSPSYQPTLPRLAADYAAHNPTRNRPLDLLPLLVHLLGRDTLQALDEDELVRPRPTYHYRLPNCRIDEADWRVADEWNRWVEVERLAARPAALHRLCAAAAREDRGTWERIKRRARALLRRGGDREAGP